MNQQKGSLLVALVIGIGLISPAPAQSRKIKREDLPPNVEKAVAENSNGASIRGFSTEVENGATLYEVELTVNGHGKDISIDKDGRVVEVEEEISMDSLPAAVREGIGKAAGAGKIGKVESLSKNGKLVAYEAHIQTGTKRSEIQVGPDGNKLAHAE